MSHQHRYGKHYQKVKEIIASGALGRVHTVYGSATGWMTHMLSHLIDYTCWFNNYTPASWAMAQAAGRAKLGDNHPSPDYIARLRAIRQRRARHLRMRRRARPTSPKSRSGGARTASARRAPKASPKCSPTAAGAR